MTERLYYADAYTRTFEAQVIDRVEVNGQPAVILDRSAFYPYPATVFLDDSLNDR